jgi:hypothetical protein
MFNRKNLFKNLKQNDKTILESDFLNFIRQDIVDRLEMLSGEFHKIIIIRDHGGFITNHLSGKIFAKDITQIEDEEDLITLHKNASNDLKEIDMIIFPFGLHFTNDVQGFLFSCKKILKDNGLLICNFASSGSLQNLRRYFIGIEEELSYPHFSHIAPLIRFDQVTALLKQAGFEESIVDMEKLELEFPTPLDLMKAIKKTGNSNVSRQQHGYTITKAIYENLGAKNYNKGNFIEIVNLTGFICSPTKKSIRLRPQKDT